MGFHDLVEGPASAHGQLHAAYIYNLSRGVPEISRGWKTSLAAAKFERITSSMIQRQTFVSEVTACPTLPQAIDVQVVALSKRQDQER